MGMAGTRSTGNKLCLWATFLNFLFQTDFGRENSASFYWQRGKAVAFGFAHHGHAMLTLTGTFDR